MINFRMTLVVGSMVKGSFGFRIPNWISKFSFKFLFPGIKMIAPVFTFKNEVLQQ